MNEKIHTLSFQKKIREGNAKSYISERTYFDIIISGQSLIEMFYSLLENRDFVSVFTETSNDKYRKSIIQEFLKKEKTEFELQRNGRTMLYMCPECGDIGCGAITAKIKILKDYVVWEDFAYEDALPEINLERYAHIGPFYFT